LPETVAPGETGLVSAPHAKELGEALHELWADAPKQAQMGARGRERVAELYSIARCGARLEAALG
jgi:glycosyltransferase involved in cell wall biosynthesis